MVIIVERPSPSELHDLYQSVGWFAYTRHMDQLVRGVARSTFVLTARNEQGKLIGLVRALSDGETIVYVQDLLVSPDHQRQGVGRALLLRLLHETKGIRQTVLITDDTASLRAFYESCGLTEAHDQQPNPALCFVRIGKG